MDQMMPSLHLSWRSLNVLIVTELQIDYKWLTSGKCLKRMQLCAEVQLKVLERTFQSIPTSALLMD